MKTLINISKNWSCSELLYFRKRNSRRWNVTGLKRKDFNNIILVFWGFPIVTVHSIELGF